MEFNCSKCNAHLLKSYGATIKLRSRSIRWDNINDTAVVQCNFCRSFNDIPLALKMSGDSIALEVGVDIKKSAKEKLVVKQ